MFQIIFVINSNYFPQLHLPASICTRDAVFSVHCSTVITCISCWRVHKDCFFYNSSAWSSQFSCSTNSCVML